MVYIIVLGYPDHFYLAAAKYKDMKVGVYVSHLSFCQQNNILIM